MYNISIFRNASKLLVSLLVLFFLVFCITVPFFVSAVGDSGGTGGVGDSGDAGGCDGKLCNPLKWDTLIEFWREILKIAAQIGSIFVVVGFVYTGFLFVRAQGNAEELQTAKRSFTYTVIGAALVLGAWAFAMAIAETVASITGK